MATTSTFVSTAGGSAALSRTTFPVASINPQLAAPTINYGSGSTAGNTEGIYMGAVSATTGGVSLNVHNSSITDVLGNALVAAHVCSIHIVNTGASTVTLTGNLITSVFGTSVPIEAGGQFKMDMPTTGWVVTGSSADTITFTATTGTVVCNVAIATRSA